MDRRAFLNLSGSVAVTATGKTAARRKSAAKMTDAGDGRMAAVAFADELAGEWRNFGDLHTLPALSSPMGACQVGSDLLSIEALTFPAFCQGGDSGKLSVDGHVLLTGEFRWYPYQVLRRAYTRDGRIELSSSVRMSHTERAVFFRLNLTNRSTASRDLHLQVPLTGMVRWVTEGWSWNIPRPMHNDEFAAELAEAGHVLLIHDLRSEAQVAFAFSPRLPARVTSRAHDGVAEWGVRLQPGATAEIDIVMCIGRRHAGVAAQARRMSNEFDTEFAAAKTDWQRMFDAAFEPGNRIFSGHLPALHTADPEVRRIYYVSVASLLAMMRGCFTTAHRADVTGSPQCAASLMYFWDSFTWPTVHALLDPANMKDTLLRWLRLNIHGCYAQDMITGGGVGPWYSFNDYSVFSQFLTYITTTGDIAFLQEKVGGRTVLQHMEQMSLWWKRLVKPYCPMADYGGRWNLLECVPTYTHVVASLNAANVWMMRQTAELHEAVGDKNRAAPLRQQADRLAREVLKLYVPGAGYWNTIHPNGERIPVRHCIDFFTVTYCMESDLPAAMRTEMAAFAEDQLLTKNWMRALSLDDPAAPESNRPDHGPMGAYDAWPPFTMEALCKLGRWSIGVSFLRRCAATTREGPFGQSHELLTAEYDSPVRKAYRGGQMYNCSCSGAFAEIMIRNYFGCRWNFNGEMNLYQPRSYRGFTGTLAGISARGKRWSITSDRNGLMASVEGEASG